MKPSKEFYNLIVSFEGLKLKAYLDTGGVWTIGVGTIIYPDGTKVKKGDVCTEAQAHEYLDHDLRTRVKFLNNIIPAGINQNQFDAMLSFLYNIGSKGFANSTAFKRIKANPNDPAIREAWMRWNKDNGKVVNGLTIRRKKEVDLYFK